jgi:hypothetical protein
MAINKPIEIANKRTAIPIEASLLKVLSESKLASETFLEQNISRFSVNFICKFGFLIT